jgi:hypothetical protein
MQYADLSVYCTVACSISACASRCRILASDVEGAGMAQSNVAATMSF